MALQDEVNELKKTIEQLNNKIKELETINEKNLKKIESLENIIDYKDEELERSKGKLNINNYKKDKLYIKYDVDKMRNSAKYKSNEKVLNFMSEEHNIFFAVRCPGESIFAEIEELLYREYPEYRETNNSFLDQGKEILRFKTIKENNIGTGKPIMMVLPSKK